MVVFGGRSDDGFHGDGDIDIGNETGLDTVETGLERANHGHGLVVDEDGLVEDGRITAELFLPIAIAKNDDGCGTRRKSIGRIEETAERGVDLEGIEIISGDEFG